ncbi:3-deoxy-7-phosphoheptulonate synthase [Thermotomaculum hydrothermale]|uniref:3-deoxy-7-phosphoheptulonate synthase n=1 Tax=Thermotomaculum hydrothermale TaxID=981385 RepID=A0A7R6PNY5_9BACT|nr:3-deoxy-7-phosphoheptulonate synthase [Thermotomaculum hydrothermale]BBB31691.1 3-deoxy-7-phosphoheptulonate synthase [Thermotomaculum hydrothermale]
MERLKATESREKKIVKIKNTKVGGGYFLFCAGPCAVESRELMKEIASYLKSTPVNLIRGGAFKPRTSPYSFQGLGEEGLKILKEVSEELNIPFVTEVTDTKYVEIVAKYADCFQIGSRNMSSFELLKEVGKTGKPVLLKRGMSATVDEFLNAAEYILNEGNDNIILCERGIRSFDSNFRNILDLNAVAYLKQKTFLPVIVDPSHGTGRREIVEKLSLAAMAAGADGLIVETHPYPEEALSDGFQSLNRKEFLSLSEKVKKFASIFNYEIQS